MGTKKRAIQISSPTGPTTPAQMKFRSFSETTRATAKGTKPLPEPTSVSEILTKVVVYACKKVLFLPPKIRITGYAVLFFLASLVADYLPFPKTYFAYSDNIPNQYFVKFSWAWTLSLVGMFVYLTSSVYCGGDLKRILRHMSRLLIGTFVWLLWTNIFRVVEESTGQCSTPEGPLYSVKGRKSCSSKSGRWTSFDVSGHAFLLMWCVLLITEEAKAIIGWDSIKDFIRNEEHNRTRAAIAGGSSAPTDLFSDTPLSPLSVEEFEKVKKSYSQFSLLANIQLVFLTALVLLWDGMMIATAVYFHVMIEKVIGALIAGLTWFVLYRCFYTWDIPISPGLPGVGLFKYSSETRGFKVTGPAYVSKNVGTSSPFSLSASSSSSAASAGTKPRNREQDLPQFLGMPLYALRSKSKDDFPSTQSVAT